jgi:hypothetical protein
MPAAPKKFAALTVLLFLSFATLYVELHHAARGRFASGVFPSVTSRTPEKSNAPLEERKTLKRGLYVEDESALSDLARAESRNLSLSEKRAEVPDGNFRVVSLSRLVHAHKVSTNLFLSVLNL